ncbi:MoxR family ATPase [uncultured Thiodictyon sp.]|jgi:MoxR-like ATPase|uniref:AAA family ATPase n=1 Tax=uncultured Thiodictyon sp. TaxID=1846217 RepID=UPI0025DF103F|nr:MoxR family ATPase [uncultured Thiodictyon sp.]
MTAIPRIPVGERLTLPVVGSWPESCHVFAEPDAYAIAAAIAAGRPLLVRGEPGVGKSQLARAAAVVCGRLFVSEVVHSRSEPQDLQWRFDAVARLGEAQALGAARVEDVGPALNPLRYLSPGVLWWTFDHEAARVQHERCRHPLRAPEMPPGWTPARGAVLLIDEIDKAEPDLPNGLLEVLGNGAFTVPYLDAPVRHREGPPPLVVITTNEERELPAAFVRRCLVLRLALPAARSEFVGFLQDRGHRHFPDSFPAVRLVVAERLWEDRQEALKAGGAPPGQAEYLDILRALTHLTAHLTDAAQREPEQARLFGHIADFALKKASVDL